MTHIPFNANKGFSIQEPPITVINNVGNYSGGTGLFTGAVTAPSFIGSIAASSITGTTLASNVVLSSLTSLGTITSGVWNGTAIGDTYISSATNWNTAYTDRLKWDGGATGLVAATGRTSLGLDIGINVQAYNATLDNVAAGTYTGSSSITTLGTLPTLAISTTGTVDKVSSINMAQGVTASNSVTSQINFYSYNADALGVPPVPVTASASISSNISNFSDLKIQGSGDSYISFHNNSIIIGDGDGNVNGNCIRLDVDAGVNEIIGGTNFFGLMDFNDSITTSSTVTVGGFVTIGTGLGLVDSKSTLLFTTAANQIISQTVVSTVYRSVEFFVQASTAGGAHEALKIMVLHDGTNTYNTQYGVIRSGGSLGTYNTTLALLAGTYRIRLRVTPTTVNTTYKVMITALPV